MNNNIIRSGYKHFFLKNTMVVNINVQDQCNFRCSYCINSASKNKMKRRLDKDCLDRFIDDLDSRNHSEYIFRVAGGEPLLYPHIEFLVDKIDKSISSKKRICFATNGSLLHKNGDLLYLNASNTTLRFLISVHLEQIDIDTYIRNIIDFGHHEDIRCKILFTPGTLNETRKIVSLFSDHQINHSISVVANSGGTPYEYSNEEIRFLKSTDAAKKNVLFHEYEDGTVEEIDRITQALHPEKMNYKEMFCAAGLAALRLAPDGTCSRCFGFLKKGEKFDLNVQRLRDIPELTRPCICPVNCCTCMTFLQAPKWRDPIHAPEWL